MDIDLTILGARAAIKRGGHAPGAYLGTSTTQVEYCVSFVPANVDYRTRGVGSGCSYKSTRRKHFREGLSYGVRSGFCVFVFPSARTHQEHRPKQLIALTRASVACFTLGSPWSQDILYISRIQGQMPSKLRDFCLKSARHSLRKVPVFLISVEVPEFCLRNYSGPVCFFFHILQCSHSLLSQLPRART